MIKILFIITVIVFILPIYCLLKLSSDISRLEEEKEKLWQQQEYGKSKKD